jgi:Na+/H+-dicarboxylate symporter
MLAATSVFPPAQDVQIALEKPEEPTVPMTPGEQIVNTFTVSDFPALLSRKNLLALIVFALLFGLSVALSGEAGQRVARGLDALSQVVFRLVALVMFFAPVGLGAYFAYLVGVFGPELLGNYTRAMLVYYPVAVLYFFIFYTLYAGVAGGSAGVRSFWRNIPTAALTALGTGSSVATIPVNLQASQRIGVPRDVREIVIPIGATIREISSNLQQMIAAITRQVSIFRGSRMLFP